VSCQASLIIHVHYIPFDVNVYPKRIYCVIYVFFLHLHVLFSHGGLNSSKYLHTGLHKLGELYVLRISYYYVIIFRL
jgi:hypothetical protein